ncbi:MAG: hypothetical protein DMD61_11030 [Gemmatimonadetes bacterium]|nr:MAG: hypothetical protein DMD61_11030 [Gemmatimonadota bacterium]
MSNTPAAGLTAPDDAVALPTELDARRELAREFQIERLLGQSPILYLARDAEDRLLAVKVVPRARFERPAEEVLKPVTAATRLDHPHIARVHSSGATDSFLWYATQYVEGRTLASLLRTVGSMELAVCLRIFEQVASALDYAHRLGIFHGALTAECIVVDSNEWVLVGDFGTAELLESVESGDVTPAADQRALALLVHQCLTGGDRSGGLPLHVSQALRRAMSTRTADRFPSVLDFVVALDDRGGGGVRVTPDVVRLEARPPTWRPLVIPDADQDPVAATRRVGGRVLAAVALLGVFAVVAAWITWSSAPTAPPSRAAPGAPATPPSPPPASPAPAPLGPVPAASPMKPSARPKSVAGPIVPAAPRPAPAPAPRRPTARISTPARAPAAVRATPPPSPAPTAVVPGRHTEPGLLSINAIPWGSVYVDGRPVGNTPQLDLPVPPGQHRLRVERQGYRPYERMIDVAPGQRLRITDITLTER